MKDISIEYGEALFTLACEADRKKEYGEALLEIARAFEENRDYFLFLQSPAVPVKERHDSLCAVFEGHLPEDVLSFLMLLCEKGRMSCFFEAQKAYQALLDASEHIASATVKSAVPLTETEKARLLEKLKTVLTCEVAATYVIDEALMGGVVIEVDGRIIDGSLRRRLSEVKGVIAK